MVKSLFSLIMDGSDEETCGFSLFSKRAKVSKGNTTEAVEVVKTVAPKKIIEKEDDRLTFKDLGLNEWVVKCCNAMRIVKPTPVQKYCIPEIIQGKNVAGVSETGSGKTAVFALPVLQRLSADPYGIFAVILTPTRELAMQIDEQIEAFGAPIHVRVSLVIGGDDFVAQAESLRERPHIVIATPGRFLQHLQTADPPITKRLGFIVLDECDRMLSSSLQSEVTEIVHLLQERCVKPPQYLFMTATYDSDVREAITQLGVTIDYEYNPHKDEEQITTVEGLEQFYLLVPDHVKIPYFVFTMLHSIVQEDDEEEEDKLQIMKKRSAIVFCNTCKIVQLLSELLRVFHIDNVCLHSLLDQRRRDAAIGKFRNNQSPVLICTDVASRGLDIPQVDLVVNFDLPQDPYDYIHRVGRTARAGREGTAVSFVTKRSVPKLQAIEELTGKKCEELEGINEQDVLTIMGKVSKSLRVAKQYFEENGFEEKIRKRKQQKREKSV